MDRAQGVMEEILLLLRGMHETLQRIEGRLTHSMAPNSRTTTRVPVEDGAGQSEPVSKKPAQRRSLLLSVDQVAAMLDQSAATVRKWVYLRKIEVVRLGRSVRIPAAEVDRIIARNRQAPAKIWQGDI
jgi:excisionase family DNA binding protein